MSKLFISIDTIVLKTKNIYYYTLIVNNNEPTSIKYDSILSYMEEYTESKRNLRDIRQYLKEYKSFAFFVKKNKLIELEIKPETKEEIKQRIYEKDIEKKIIKQYKKNTKKNNFQDLWKNYGKM